MLTPTFYKLGCPTDETLDIIKSWDYPFAGLWEFVRSALSIHGKIVESDNIVKLTTGGWSGNENIVTALQGNTLFWSCYWRASVRGGVEVFDKPSASSNFLLEPETAQVNQPSLYMSY
jgi:hypothetical protein